MKERLYKKIDFNTLLLISNFIIPLVAIFSYIFIKKSIYVNGLTILYLLLFSILNMFILLYEKKYSNPFLTLLMFNIIIFYMGRIFTLIYFPWSYVLLRNNLNVNEINYTILFIVLSTLFIVLGLILGQKKYIDIELYKKEKKIIVNPLVILGILTIILLYSITKKFVTISTVKNILTYLEFFINIKFLLIVVLVYLVSQRKYLSKKIIYIFLFGIGTYVIIETLIGNRSGIYNLIVFTFISILAVKSRIKMNKKIIFYSILAGVLAIILFYFANFLRNNFWFVNENNFLETIKTFFTDFDFDVFKYIFRLVFARIGFLDMSSDLIANGSQYKQVINFQYYFKSIIDDITPGFDVFNVSRASNVLSYIYNNEGIPSTKEIFTNKRYHSDLFTLFGEYYILFKGYFSLVFLFITSFLFSKFYYCIKFRKLINIQIYRALILYIFFIWLNSYGLDWTIVQLFSLLITALISSIIYRIKI